MQKYDTYVFPVTFEDLGYILNLIHQLNFSLGKTVSNLIASLGDDDGDEEMAADNEHAVFVTDDEMARMAAQTVMELVS